MINKYFTVMGIMICLMCLFGIVVVHETEETKRILATQEFQSKAFEASWREA